MCGGGQTELRNGIHLGFYLLFYTPHLSTSEASENEFHENEGHGASLFLTQYHFKMGLREVYDSFTWVASLLYLGLV